MKITRRSVLAGLSAAPLLAAPRFSIAQSQSVILGSWGGGTAKVWREFFGQPFQKQTGIPVNVAELPDPSAAVAAARGRPQHNVIIAAGYQAATLAHQGLIEELNVDDIPAIKETSEEFWLKSESGKLLGMPTYFSYYGIAYNSKVAKAEDFMSWKVLAEPKWKGKISLSIPVFLAPYDLTLLSLIEGGSVDDFDKGKPLLKAMAQNAYSMYTSMASLQQQLALGDVVAAPFYASQVQLLRQAGQTDVNITVPQEKGLALPYVLAIPKNAPNREAALQFLNSVISPEKQNAAAMHGYMPVTKGATLTSEVTAAIGMTLDEVRQRTISPDWYRVAANLNERISACDEIVAAIK